MNSNIEEKIVARIESNASSSNDNDSDLRLLKNRDTLFVEE